MIIENISKSFSRKQIIKDFSLEIPTSAITCLIGPSGCGKSTLLNIVSGLIQPDSGKVSEVGKVSYLFQEPRLLPWKSVWENVTLAVNDNKIRAAEFLRKVGLENDFDKYPDELSGGMKQRVALARAFAFESDTILMDEPFQNLDIELKSELLKTFIEIWKADRRTVLWVTHDVTEACLIANRIVCVGKNPMQIKYSAINAIPQSKRSAESISGLQAQILKNIL